MRNTVCGEEIDQHAPQPQKHKLSELWVLPSSHRSIHFLICSSSFQFIFVEFCPHGQQNQFTRPEASRPYGTLDDKCQYGFLSTVD
jgi:hypothetical protein